MKFSSALFALQGCLDGLQEAVWLIDACSHRVLFANAAAALLARQPAEDFVDKHVLEIASTPQDAAFWSEPAQVIAKGIDSVSSLLRSDGMLLSVERRVATFSFPGFDSILLMGMVDRSEQQAGQREMETLLVQLRATLDSVADGILVCGLDGSVHAFNRQFACMWKMPTGLFAHDDNAVHAFMAACVSDPLVHAQRLRMLALAPDEPSNDLIALRDGRTLERRSVPQICLGDVTGRVFSFRDITAELEWQEDLRLVAQVFECSTDAIFIADQLHQLVRLNPAGESLLGQPLGKLRGCSVMGLLEKKNAAPADVAAQAQQAWVNHGVWCSEVSVVRPSGTCAMHLSWVAVRDASGQRVKSIGFLRDLSEQQKEQQRMYELACTDSLTALPNRLLMAQRVQNALLQAQVPTEKHGAVLCLGVDGFKIIKDSLGPSFGDRVLKLVAARLQSGLRPGDMLCRQGDDGFFIYLHECSREVAEAVVHRVLDEMRRPFTLDSIGFSIQCSLGAAMFAQDGDSLDDLFKHAETAMYRSSKQGQGSYGFYQPQMHADVLQRMQMEQAMRRALEHGRMSVLYQPQVQFGSSAVAGAEALLRWTDPQLGSVPPAVFIALAEETGYIVTLGAWVLEQAVQQAVCWLHAGTPMAVSVNVSALEFRQPDFVEKLAKLLQLYGLPAQLLELELAESILMQDVKQASHRLASLAALGVSLTIDDFGAGYCSLAKLKELPISKLKIDPSLVRSLTSDGGAHAIVSAIVHLGQALGMAVLAKGVETQAQHAVLERLGCNYFQGYLCAPALTPSAFDALLQTRAALNQLEVKPFQSM